MPIPPFNTSGVLPPFVGDNPTNSAQMAPFAVDFTELVQRFGTSTDRWKLLGGLHSYREELRASGLQTGFQWIDGSFIEDIEKTRGRPPADIDVVTFTVLPAGVSPRAFQAQNSGLFDRNSTRLRFHCDAYFVDLGIGTRRPDLLVAQSRYWYGLFSHQRASYLWKGMLQIDLFSDDDAVKRQLAQTEGSNAPQT